MQLHLLTDAVTLDKRHLRMLKRRIGMLKGRFKDAKAPKYCRVEIFIALDR